MVTLGIDKQKEHLDILMRNKAFQFTETFFPYTSGQIGPYYVQSADITKSGSDFSVAANDMTSLVTGLIPKDGREVIISGGETRDWVFSFLVAARLGLPHTMIYKDRKIIGADMNGKYVLHVADLNNEGSSTRDMWVPAIKKAGGTIENIFFYVDRMEEGTQVIKKLGLKSHSIVSLDEHAWAHLGERWHLDKTIYENLLKRTEDRDAWAHEMLNSEAGFARFVELLEQDRDKALKIMIKGYPEIKGELKARLKRQHPDVYKRQISHHYIGEEQ